MLKTFCNGCGVEMHDPKEVRSVEFIEASLEGVDQSPGLRTDRSTEGHLCTGCRGLVRALVSEDVTTDEIAERAVADLPEEENGELPVEPAGARAG